MTLSAGTRLGPYEIVGVLGAGGMGEVYRARDARLGREVAVKVLPTELASDPDRRRRFEKEARAASGLSHPGIVSIYDIGTLDSTVYIAMELVEGQTLRQALAGEPLATKKLLDLGVQMADALASAHAAGIVHRDLKPENVMISKSGYVKLLDFGLAKLTLPESDELTNVPTQVSATRPGMVMGTVGYMSPEQASGRAVDFPSDQFSLGAILYEMATARRAFQRGTTAETLTAIIREEPEPVVQHNPRTPPPLRWLIERCLAKDPEERFGTTRDLARDLAAVRDHLSDAAIPSVSGEVPAASARPAARKWPWIAGALALAALAAAAAYSAGRRAAAVSPPTFRQLTFQRGEVYSARFAPDGQTVLYAAAWEGRPVEIFVSRLDSPESRPFGLAGADVFAISSSGEMAVSLGRHWAGAFVRSGMLARIGITGGGTPREVQGDVQWADWSPDGTRLAIVRDVAGRSRLEFPIGQMRVETNGWISHPRVSPGGDAVAFMLHPARGDDGGTVGVVDHNGKSTTLTKSFSSEGGLAWSPDGREVFFTAAETGGNRVLWAVKAGGSPRLMLRVTGNLTLQDVSRDGRILINHETFRSGIFGLAAGAQKERDLSWLDWSTVYAISRDGKTVTFSESGEGGGPRYSVYARNMDGSPPVRLGNGTGFSISPDARWVAVVEELASAGKVVLLPIGAGEPKPIPTEGLLPVTAEFLPDGKRLLISGTEPGRGSRLYIREIEGGKIRPVTPEGYRVVPGLVSPEGNTVVVTGPDNRTYLYPLNGGEPVPLNGLREGEIPACWSGDGRSIYAAIRGEYPTRVYRIDITTGKRELWRELSPPDPTGIYAIGAPRITPDGRAYAYSYNRILSDIFLAEGVK